MRVKLFITAIVIISGLHVFGQTGIINNGAKISISNNAIIDINGTDGNYINQSYDVFNYGRIDLAGKIKLQGNWQNNATSGNVFIGATDTDGLIVFDGIAPQTIGGDASTYFEKFTLNNSFGLDLVKTTVINGNLTLTSGILNIGAYNLELGINANVMGTPTAANMIVPNSTGKLYKYFNATQTFVFPVGDTTGINDYSPYQVVINDADFATNAYIALNVTNSKHPQNTSTTHFINRYWSVTSGNLSAFDIDVTANYVEDDINIGATESNIYSAKYDSPYWNIFDAANTVSNLLTANVSSFSDFTGAESSAVVASITINDDGALNEGYENGELITVTLVNDDFVPSLNTTNWTLSNLPAGVTKGTLTRTGDKTATLELSGNRLQDFDLSITDVTLSIAADELVNKTSGTVEASSGVTIVANNDAESISISDDGLITEGNEDGEVITVTAVGGTFASTITASNWTLSNLPTGVTKGALNKIDAYTVEITLSGNASVDYDTDITNATLTITNSEIDEYSGVDLSVSSGVTFSAIDESLTITMSDDGLISEGSENGEVITVTITGRDFAASLTQGNWTVSNLPAGVTKGTVTRVSNTVATIALSGNRTQDYDDDITNVTVEIAVGEIDSYTSVAYVTSGVTLTATDDVESIALADDGTLEEGVEDGETILVNLSGGTFADPIDEDNWSFTNMPEGVGIASITRNSATQVAVVLDGNAAVDYDNNITDFTVTIASAEVSDTVGASMIQNTGVQFTATNDSESISITDDSEILEGAENGEIITVTLSGGNFVNPIDTANWTFSNLPVGVSIGNVTRISNTTVQITLSGNATDDYDSDITNFMVSITSDEIDDMDSGSVADSDGVIFIATDEDVIITIADNGIVEGAESNGVITVSITEDTFVDPINPLDWSMLNLPTGVSINSVTRVSDDTVTITLTGNRMVDYDTDITDATVSFEGTELTQHNTGTYSQASGLVFDANNDAETIAMEDDGEIIEGSESGEEIEVTLSGGTFATPLNVIHWVLTGAPSGVTIGGVTKNSATSATVTLSGDASADYDEPITDAQLSIAAAEIDDHATTPVTVSTGITFTPIIESINIAMDDDGEILEGAESGENITVTISNDIFADPINENNWVFSYLPGGVTVDTIIRNSDTEATITLLGNRTQDYDSDITNASLTISADQFENQSSDVVVATGVTFVANNDEESLAMNDDGEITEGAESGEIITIEITNGTFASALNTSNWNVINLPSGVSLGSLFRLSANTAEITLSGNATEDYDAAITNVTVSLTADEIDDYTGSDITINTGVSMAAIIESMTIANDGLKEDSLNGAEILITLTNDTFEDAALEISNFTLNNAPAGLSIDNLVYQNANKASLILSFDGSDFDVDYDNFNITVAASELSGYGNITSNDLSITAHVESVQLVMTDDGIIEGSEDGEKITISVREDAFVNPINPTNWTVNNLPQGVSKGTVTRVTSDTVTVTLSGKRQIDFDTDITNIEVQIAADEFVNTTSLQTISNGVVINANNDPEYLVLDDSEIAEGAEDGEVIYVSLFGGTFTESLTPENWTLNNLPAGVSKGTLTKIDSVSAQITLNGNATKDYDENITNIELVISGTEIDEYSDAEISVNSGVTFVANNDPEYLVFDYDGTIIEGAEDGEVITVNLSGGTFVDTIKPQNWTFYNLPVGVSVANLIRNSATQVQFTLNGNRSEDYDNDITDFSLIVIGDQVDDVIGENLSVTSGITFKALQESANIYHAGLTEENLNNAIINLTLNNETFYDDVLDSTNFVLHGAPAGVALNSSVYVSENTANLTLSFDGTDFDTDFDALYVIINQEELSGTENLTTDTLAIAAVNDEETLVMADDGSIVEGSENGETIQVTLSGGTFVKSLDPMNWSFSELPDGVSIDSVKRLSTTAVEIVLLGNTTQDYDTSLTDVSLTIQPYEINDHEIGEFVLTEGVSFTAVNELLSIAHEGLTESNLDGASIDISLTNELFADNTLAIENFILNNAPTGVTINKITYNSNSTAKLTLAYDGTDFDLDVTDFSITILASEILGVGSVTSNELTIEAVIESQTASISHIGLSEDNLNNAEILFILENETFVNDQLSLDNFILNAAPEGSAISEVIYSDDTTATIILSYDGTDFDSDYEDFAISVFPDEINGTSSVTSNTLTITAINDEETIALSYDGEITEGSEDGEVIMVDLSGGTFVSDVLPASWVTQNLPDGVTVSIVDIVSPIKAQLTLAGNASVDYDTDITNFTLQIQPDQVNDHTEGAVTANTGVVFTAIHEIENKSLTISHSGLNELNLDGAQIQAQLAEDYLIGSQISSSNLLLHNQPFGTSVKSVEYIDSLNFSVTLAFDGSDFDSTIVNFNITLLADALNGNEAITSNDLEITGNIESEELILSHTGLNENNLDAAVINLKLINETFLDDVLSSNNFVLTNAPDTTIITQVNYLSDTTATLTLAYDGTDFDEDIPNFSIVILGDELLAGRSIRSNDINITAIDDAEVITITSVDELVEQDIDGKQITLSISGGNFEQNLSASNWQVVSGPENMAISNVQRLSDYQVILTFDGTTMRDFDQDFDTVKIAVHNSQINDQNTDSLYSDNFAVTAVNEFIAVDPMEIQESELQSAELTITLIGDQFADGTLLANNFTLSPNNIGAEISEVHYVNNTEATVTLAYSGVDFDTNKSLTLSVNQNELAYSDSIQSGLISLIANDDDETFTLDFDGEILEGAENGEEITLAIEGGTFIAAPDIEKFTFSNLPGGVTVGSIAAHTSSSITFVLSGNTNTDYDDDITDFTVIIDASQYDDAHVSGTVNTGVIFTAIVESTGLTIANPGLNELNLDAAEMALTLHNTSFVDAPKFVDINLNNAPVGLSVADFVKITDTTATVILAFDGTDFDTDFTDFSITLLAAATTNGSPITSNALAIIASIEPVFEFTYDGEITEGSEDGEVITCKLLEGTFSDDLSGIVIFNLPTGVGFTDPVMIDNTEIEVSLSGNRTQDYDIDITSLDWSFMAYNFNNYLGSDVVTSDAITIMAFDETLTIAHEGLNEENLSGAVIALTLTEDYFIDDQILAQNITLYNAPAGLSIDSVEYISETQLNVILAFDGTDFSADIDNFYLQMSADELFGLTPLTSNSLLIQEGVGVVDNLDELGLSIYAQHDRVVLEINHLPKTWSEARVAIYDTRGQLVYSGELAKASKNYIDLNVYTGYYFIKTTINGIAFAKKLFILPK